VIPARRDKTIRLYFMFLNNQNIITKLNGIIINLMEKRKKAINM
jgi:hypothetical protein